MEEARFCEASQAYIHNSELCKSDKFFYTRVLVYGFKTFTIANSNEYDRTVILASERPRWVAPALP